MSELTSITSPTDIERAIETYLVSRIEAIRKTAIQRNMRYIFNNPAITVAILKAKSREVGRRSFRFDPIIDVMVTFYNAKSEEDRREAINPLVIAIIRALTRKKLGLDIDELKPTGFREVTEEEDYKENKILFLLEFTTHFFLQGDEDEIVDDLLPVGLSYLLKPGDAVVDATDTIDLPDLPKG